MTLAYDDPVFQLALHAPICRRLLRDDVILTENNGWFRTLTPSSPWAADDNEILFSNLQPDDIDGQIDRLMADYQQLGRPMRWCVYPWTQPANLGERLLARGATQSRVRALVVETSMPLQSVEGADIERVDPQSDQDYDTYINFMAGGIMSAGKTLPEDEVNFRRKRYRELISGPNPTMHLFLARYQGTVGGCGAVYIKDNSAWLTGDYVAPAFQARGLFQSLIAKRLQVLQELGIQWATGHGREETSVPWLIRFGFKPVFAYQIYQIDMPKEAA